ncbi:MAG: ABC transporter permease [Planctomycetota bacterium]|jgi:NitT/TauT family transport system permease protein|nr:ABC transporter permease [Planctomycetota bacterium]
MKTPKFIAWVLPPAIATLVGLSFWWITKISTGYPDYILPGPDKVYSALSDNLAEAANSTGLTLISATSGLLISVVMGSLISIVFCQSKWIRRSLFPLAIFLQTVPIVAIAPIVVLWLDEGLVATIFISFLVSVFPIITNTTTGLLNVHNDHYDLFHLYQASRYQRLIRLQIPSALPSFVSGLKVAGGMAVLGSVVGEFFCATLNHKGLGRQIFELKDHNVAFMYACIMLATLLGVSLFALISLLSDRFLLYWDEKKISNL